MVQLRILLTRWAIDKFLLVKFLAFWQKATNSSAKELLPSSFKGIEVKEMFFFLVGIVMGDERWFHHFSSKTKCQSMEWNNFNSPSQKKARTVPLARKVVGTVFGDAEGWILAVLLEPGETIDYPRYVHTVHKVSRELCYKRLGRKLILLQHDIALPRSASSTSKIIENKRDQTFLPHRSYRTGLAPSDYHPLRFVQNQM